MDFVVYWVKYNTFMIEYNTYMMSLLSKSPSIRINTQL